MSDSILTVESMSEAPHENFAQLDRNFFRMNILLLAMKDALTEANAFLRGKNDAGEAYMFLPPYGPNALPAYYGLRDRLIKQRDTITKVIEGTW